MTTEPALRKDMHTVSILVANKPGVLVRVALVFARRGYNIDSLVVSSTVDPRFSRMTIAAQGNPETLDQIIKQVSKLVDVIHASEHRPDEAVAKELALVKLRSKPSQKTVIEKLLKRYHAHLIDDTDHVLIIEQTGDTAQLDELENELKKFGLTEMVRTGKLVMARGKEKT